MLLNCLITMWNKIFKKNEHKCFKYKTKFTTEEKESFLVTNFVCIFVKYKRNSEVISVE